MASQARTLTVYLAADTRKASAAVGGFSSKLSSFAKGAGIAALAAATYGVIKAFDALGEAIADSVNIASDLQEATSKSAVIFGDAAGQIDEWASTMAQGFGISRLEALKAAGDFGVFAKAAKLSADDAAAFSSGMVELAADMASFSNTSVEQAIGAIGAALRAESEPIRTYGVLLDAATLKARALKLGLIESTTEALSPANRVLAAQAEILKQTTDAQGDYARTSDGLANSQKRVSAQLEDVKGKIGEALLPAVEELTRWVADELMPAFEEWWQDNGPQVVQAIEDVWSWLKNDLIPTMQELWRQIDRDVLPIMEDLADIVGELFGAFGDFSDALDESGDAAGDAEDKYAGVTAIVDALEGYVTLLKLSWSVLTAAVKFSLQTWAFIINVFRDVYDWLADVNDKLAELVRAFLGAARSLWDAGWQLIEGLLQGMQSRWAAVTSWATNAVSNLTGAVKRVLGIQSPSRVFMRIGGDVVEGLEIGLRGLSGVADDVVDKLEDMAEKSADRLNALADRAQDALADARQALLDYREEIAGTIADTIDLGSAWDAFTDEDVPVDWYQSLKDQAYAAQQFAYALDELADMGASQALVDQIASMGPGAGTAMAQDMIERGLIPEVDRILSSTQLLGNQTGKFVAGVFYQPGVDGAKQLLAGLADAIAKESKRLEKLGAKLGVQLSVGMIDELQRALARWTSTSRSSSGSSRSAASQPVVLQIDGRTLGTVVVEQLQAYSATNGAVRGVRLAS